MKKYKCGDYLRLSKEDLLKKDDSSSIESQRMIIESFCKYHNLELEKGCLLCLDNDRLIELTCKICKGLFN